MNNRANEWVSQIIFPLGYKTANTCITWRCKVYCRIKFQRWWPQGTNLSIKFALDLCYWISLWNWPVWSVGSLSESVATITMMFSDPSFTATLSCLRALPCFYYLWFIIQRWVFLPTYYTPLKLALVKKDPNRRFIVTLSWDTEHPPLIYL